MIRLLKNIACKAGEIILSVYNSQSISFELKPDNSPVTAADKESSSFICNELGKHFNFPVLSEENPVDYSVRKTWNTYWLIDPLDGTKDFLAKNDEFAINISLIENCRPILGLIYAPAKEELYYSEKDKGVFFESKGIITKLQPMPNQEYIMARSNFHDTYESKIFAEKNNIKISKQVGSSIKFGRMAKGEINIYPRFTGSSEWDIAAGHAILSEFGGTIIDLSSKMEVEYNKPSLRNNHFIAVSDTKMIDKLIFP